MPTEIPNPLSPILERARECTFAPEDLQQANIALFALADKVDIASALSQLTERKELVRKIASQSYRHVNGFDKIVLHRNADPEFCLRLHIWWPDRTDESGVQVFRIHSHRWDFYSRILVGGVDAEFFSVDDETGLDVHAYLCVPPLGRNHHEMQSHGVVKVRKTLVKTFREGASYGMSFMHHHRVLADRTHLTASLVLRGPVRRQHSTVHTATPISQPEHILLSKLSEAEVGDSLTRFATAIS